MAASPRDLRVGVGTPDHPRSGPGPQGREQCFGVRSRHGGSADEDPNETGEDRREDRDRLGRDRDRIGARRAVGGGAARAGGPARSGDRAARRGGRLRASLPQEGARDEDRLRLRRRTPPDGRLALKDHDARGKIDLARVTGKDGIHGKRLNQLQGRLSQARMKMDSFKVKKTYKMGIWMSGAKSKRNTLFNLPAGSLSLGGDRCLHFPDLSMKPDDRIALTGLNGSGKST